MNDSYHNRINRVVDYIQANLDRPLSVEKLCDIACFSEFHFNRIFKKVMAESVYQFIKRLRLEKAAEQLLTHRQASITEIALMCGFANSSSFAKSFKQHFKMTASAWRNQSQQSFDHNAHPLQIERGHLSFLNGSAVWNFPQQQSIRQVEIEQLDSFKIAYVRHIGDYQANEAVFSELYQQLFQWALPRGYVDENTLTLNVYHDNPQITDPQHLRVMSAIPVNEHVEATKTIGITSIQGGHYGVCRFLLNKHQFGEAWQWMFATWLPQSGYQKQDAPSFERSYGQRMIDGERCYDVDICIPITPK
jgi:AraC family transcriptional regulator